MVPARFNAAPCTAQERERESEREKENLVREDKMLNTEDSRMCSAATIHYAMYSRRASRRYGVRFFSAQSPDARAPWPVRTQRMPTRTLRHYSAPRRVRRSRWVVGDPSQLVGGREFIEITLKS